MLADLLSGEWNSLQSLPTDCIVGAAVVAAGLVPALVVAYRRVIIPRRLDDLRTNIWSEKAAKRYVSLFTPEDEDKFASKKDLDPLVERTFFQIHEWSHYLSALVLLTALLGAVVTICTLWIEARLHEYSGIVSEIPEPIILALAGSYVWSVYETLSRIRSRDLTPDNLVEMSLRQIAAVPIGYAFSQFAIEKVEGAFAFAAAAFPLRDVRLLFRQRMLRKLDQTLSVEEARTNAGLLARVVDGLSSETLARLQELGIVTFMDLAYADPVRLMARTGYSMRHVIAWIDQALFGVYALATKDAFVAMGIPCALDACEFYEAHCYDKDKQQERDWKNDIAVKDLADRVKVPVEFIPEILGRVWKDPHVRFLGEMWYSGTTV